MSAMTSQSGVPVTTVIGGVRVRPLPHDGLVDRLGDAGDVGVQAEAIAGGIEQDLVGLFLLGIGKPVIPPGELSCPRLGDLAGGQCVAQQPVRLEQAGARPPQVGRRLLGHAAGMPEPRLHCRVALDRVPAAGVQGEQRLAVCHRPL
jgi:hypothetical protein